MNAAEDEWGEERMFAEVQAHTNLNAEALLQHLFRAADAFAVGAPQHDDMTIVILQGLSHRTSILRHQVPTLHPFIGMAEWCAVAAPRDLLG